MDHMSVVWVSSLVAWFSKLSGREFGYLPFQVKVTHSAMVLSSPSAHLQNFC